MTRDQKEQIATLREQGLGYATIAAAVGVKKSTVVSFLRRSVTAEIEPPAAGDHCLNCGEALPLPQKSSRRKFCSDRCRLTWWRTHQSEGAGRASPVFTCTHCGKSFTAYGTGRKYCTHQCYIADRYKGGDCNG